MLIDSVSYLLFILLCFSIYSFIEKPLFLKWSLLTFSVLFILSFGAGPLCAIIVILSLNYFLSLYIQKHKVFFYLSILLNVFLLFLYRSLHIFHWENSWAVPIGFSFCALQIISYHFEVTENPLQFKKNFLNFCLYILFFPKIMSGPIERPAPFFDQIDSIRRNKTVSSILSALLLIFFGLIKKNIFADRVSAFIDPYYVNPSRFSAEDLYGTFCVLLTYFQIYLNLSAYTDIAIGTARLFGIQLSRNFNYPFLAKNLSDFWGRNHISLVSWFKDYVFLPLAVIFENRHWRTFSLLITFLLCGLWHGLGISFLIWGALNGFIMIFTHFFQRRFKFSAHLFQSRFLSIPLTFLTVAILSVFGHSRSLPDTWLVYENFFSVKNLSFDFFKLSPLLGEDFLVLVFFVPLMFAQEKLKDHRIFSLKSVQAILIFLSFFCWVMLKYKSQNLFTYTQF